MHRPAAQLDAFVRLADQLRTTALRALPELARRMAEHDGYPSGRADGAGRGSAELTTVERAAGHLLPLNRDRSAILGAIDSASAEIHRAITIAQRYLPQIDPTALRCTGGVGEPGHLDWGRPDCTDIAEADRRGGLCVACRKRRDRWKNGQAEAA